MGQDYTKPEFKQAQKDFLKGRKTGDLTKAQTKKYEALKDTAAEYVTAEEIAEIEAVEPNVNEPDPDAAPPALL